MVASDQPPFLLITPQTVQFNAASDAWLDVAEFLASLERRQLEQAAALYRGELLKGLFVESIAFDEWFVVQRERLHRLALEALYQLTRQCRDWGDYTKAQMYAHQQLSLEPWREEAHRQLMRVLALSGQRSAALAQYESCRRSLAEELGVEPEAETKALYEQIKAERESGRVGEWGSGRVGARAGSSVSLIAPSPSRHIVGRERERAELRAEFESARAGRGRVVCVSGEPGIGKTTLIEDFLAEMTTDGPSCAMARGSCSERLAGTEAYLPWLEALDSLLQGVSGEWASRRMRRLAPNWYAQVASLSPDAAPAAPSAEQVTPSPERMKRELKALLQDIARLRPLVLFFDDMHWADASTIDLLAYLASGFDALPVLVVVAYRPTVMALVDHPFLKVKLEWQGRGLCRELPLAFLSADDVERYLALEFPDHQFPTEFAALIHAKTEGNPLFMFELVRHLRDRQIIAQEPGGWVLAQSVPDVERDLPESIRSLIRRKIGQLREGDRRLLVAASVQGYEFDSAVVARTLAAEAADVEERLQVLDRVYAFVRLMGEEEFPDHTLTSRYHFVHLLYQNALYASLRPTRRSQFRMRSTPRSVRRGEVS